MTLHSLKLENFMKVINPLHQWHFRTADKNKTPVLNDLRVYQDCASLKVMTEPETLTTLSDDELRPPSRLLVKFTPRKTHHFGPCYDTSLSNPL
jgi:hypothetical protein